MSVREKVYVKKSRRGNVVLAAREHYLRDDLSCGARDCPSCPKKSVGLACGRVGPADLVYLPDASACLRQIDVVQSGQEGLCNVLMLQTVLREVRRRSAENYDRLRELLVSPPDGVNAAIFSNENRRETYVERGSVGESESEYDFKSFTGSVNWLGEHWQALSMRPVVLTDDASLVPQYKEAGVEAALVKSVVETCDGLRELYAERDDENDVEMSDAPDGGKDDQAAKDAKEGPAKKERFRFPDYYPERRVRAGVKAGRLYKGTYRPSRYNVLESWVSVCMDSSDRSQMTKVLLHGREYQNRSIDGDVVIVELLPKEQWRAASNRTVEQDEVDVQSDDENEGEEGLVKTDAEKAVEKETTLKSAERVVCGRVVAISRRSWRPYCGAISPSSFTGGERALFVPVDGKVPKVRIRSRRLKELLNQRLIVIIDKWDRSSIYPTGHVVKEIGNSGDIDAETDVILIENGIPTRPFSKAALACLPDETWRVSEVHYKGRWDLREWTLCSVDPPGCTDIDDVLHFRRLGDDEVEVGVHIADVTAFVTHDSALDKEAAERGTTTYLVNTRKEMLPGLLSGKFCSLQGGEERLAFSALIRMKNDGTVLGTEFGRSVIKSSAALTYQKAQEKIDAARKALEKNPGAEVDKVTQGLLGLAEVALHLRAQRTANGALTLASPEMRFEINELTHEVTDASTYSIRETNRMVEEFMLLANIEVAKKIFERYPHCAMLRRHPKPSEEMFEALIKAAESAGYTVDVSNSRKLNDSLAKIDSDAKKKGDDYMGTLLRILATRCMTQAVYFSSGEVSQPEFLHYGLAAPVYTHFTSPIRRYADVIVHRLLAACMNENSLPMTLQDSKRMSEVADVINERHHCAQYASRASNALFVLQLFKDKLKRYDKIDDEWARIMRVMGNGLVVLVPGYGVEGIVHIEDDQAPVLDPLKQTLTVKGGKVFKVLDKLRVRIRVDTAPERRDRVLYELA